jgi:hypothetical protein
MRSLWAGSIMLASAGVGYAASLVWPLPTPYVAIFSPSTVAASAAVKAPAHALPAADVAPSALTLPALDTPPERTVAAPAAPVVDIEPTPQARAAAAVEQAPAEKATDAGEAPTAVRTEQDGNPSVNPVATAEYPRRALSGRRARANPARVAGGPARGKEAEVQFAPNPRPDQPLRDFMASKAGGN